MTAAPLAPPGGHGLPRNRHTMRLWMVAFQTAFAGVLLVVPAADYVYRVRPTDSGWLAILLALLALTLLWRSAAVASTAGTGESGRSLFRALACALLCTLLVWASPVAVAFVFGCVLILAYQTRAMGSPHGWWMRIAVALSFGLLVVSAAGWWLSGSSHQIYGGYVSPDGRWEATAEVSGGGLMVTRVRPRAFPLVAVDVDEVFSYGARERPTITWVDSTALSVDGRRVRFHWPGAIE
jgi:hypothetical protein